jgi:hypothetical protein
VSTCVAVNSDRMCGQDSAGRLAAGCAHEHIADNPFCAMCARFWRQEIAAGRVICPACCDGRKPHECLLHEIAWELVTEVRRLDARQA